MRPLSLATSNTLSCDFNGLVTSQPLGLWYECGSCRCCSGLMLVRQNSTAFVDSLQPMVVDEKITGDSTDELVFHTDQSNEFFQQNFDQYASFDRKPPFSSNHCTSPHYNDIILLQDESCFTPFCEFLNRASDPKYLKSLIIVDCKLQWDPNIEPFEKTTQMYNLHTLILTKTKLKKIPVSIFEMSRCLKILKLDNNYLDEIPEKISQLSKLEVFSCNSQRPRLRFLSKSFASMTSLEVQFFFIF